MAQALCRNPLALCYRGTAVALADAFNVHRTTAWRDLQRILDVGPVYNLRGPDGVIRFIVSRACQGGPIENVTDADGNEIRGAERRHVLRQLRQLRL